MKHLVRPTAGSLFWLSLVALILMAVLMSAIRFAAPLIPEHSDYLKEKFFEATGRKIDFSSIETQVDGFSLIVQLQDVVVSDEADAAVSVAFPQASIDLNFLHMLLKKTYMPKLITIKGADLDVEMDGGKGLSVQNQSINLSNTQSENNPIKEDQYQDFKNIRLSFLESSLSLFDQSKQRSYEFSDLNVTAEWYNNGLYVAGDVRLPKEYGSWARVALDLEGDLSSSGNWSAELFVQGDELNAKALNDFSQWPLPVKEGGFNGSIWAEWNAKELDRVTADVHVNNWVFQNKDIQPVDDLKGKIDLLRTDNGWVLSVVDALWSEANESNPMELQVAFDDVDGIQQLKIAASDIYFDEWSVYLPHLPNMNKDVIDLLLEIDPVATIKNTSMVLQKNPMDQWAVFFNADVDGVSTQVWNEKIGVDNFSGELELSGDNLVVLMDTAKAELSLPSMFYEPFEIDQLAGLFEISLNKEGVVVSGNEWELSTPHIKTKGRAYFDLTAGNPFMDVFITGYEAGFSSVASYIPRGQLNDDAHSWLSKAFQSGSAKNISLMMHGNPMEFPFRNGTGMFELVFDAKDVRLKYGNNWPVAQDVDAFVLFRNEGLYINGRSASYKSLHSKQITVAIPDFNQTTLVMNASLLGSADDWINFVQNSPLSRNIENTLDDLQLSGTADVDLALIYPLSSKTQQDFRILGDVDLKQSNILFKSSGVKFEQVSGNIEFTGQSLSSTFVDASFQGRPLEVVISTQKKPHKVVIDVAGRMQPGKIVQSFIPELKDYLSGGSDWSAKVLLPLSKGSKDVPRISLASTLNGVEITMPYPMNKAKQTDRPFHMDIDLHKESKNIAWSLGKTIFARHQIGQTHRGQIAFDQPAKLPDRDGLSIAGHLTTLNLDTWIKSAEDKKSRSKNKLNLAKLPFNQLDLSVDQLIWRDQDIVDIDIDAINDGDHWKMDIDHDWIKGRFEVPNVLDKGQPLVATIDHLYWPKSDANEAPDEKKIIYSPFDFPPLKIKAKNLSVQGFKLDQMRLETTPKSNGMEIHLLELDIPDTSLKIRGDWNQFRDHQATQLSMQLNSKDLGKALNYVGLDSGLSGSKTKASMNISWPSSFFGFTFDGLEGNGKVDVRDGRVAQLDPGAGRLVGLLNIESLPRRVLFDLKDVAYEGFTFDRVKSDFTLQNKNMYLSKLNVSSPAASVKMNGRLGLQQQDYDLDMSVTPAIGNTIPVAAALASGVTAGITVLFYQKLLGIDKGINEAATLKYRITGPWADPKVKEIKPPEPKEDEFDY